MLYTSPTHAPSPIVAREISMRDYDEFLKRIAKPENRQLSFGSLRFEGEFDLKCRELPTKSQKNNGEPGELAWELKQKNLVTDFGRRKWFDNAWSAADAQVFVSPSTEIPVLGRYALLDLGGNTQANSQSQWATAVGPSNNPSTLTRSWSPPALSTPPFNKIIGTVGLTSNAFGYNASGVYGVYSFSLISPAKTQTITQTLEIVYSLAAVVTL